MIKALLSILFPASCRNCHTQGKPLCDSCLGRARKNLLSPYPFIVAIFDYKDPLIRRSIHAIKYFGRKDLVEPFSLELAKNLPTIPNYKEYILVPIPMPIVRKYIRGYNQSEVLARHLALQCAMRVDTSLLIRHKTPKRQVGTTGKHERLTNQKGTFICGNVSGKQIMLIDDVTTTGATLMEARKTLLQAGASDVKALVIAH